MMLPSMWFMSIIAILVVDVRTGALQQKDAALRRCYHCAANGTACHATVECPGDRPLCATSAVVPNYSSSLHCAAASKTPCSLTRSSGTFILTCVCADDLCNSAFSKELQNQLLEFSKSNVTNNNSSDYTDMFFKSHSFANVTEDKLYKTITVEVVKTTEAPKHNVTNPTTVSTAAHTRTTISHPVEVNLPRAEAFKHEPTALSDDDEDASEGSGSYEETRSQRQPASAPAAPSSYLPANENKAPPLTATLLIGAPILMYFVA
ncbi:uncharacterized protein LOC114351562 [Ostrinia furnacalis]|uniref:uncharacterized protein LOC114351562 n=1 Tax=Ostrinia furnacalis TaxID=93504 RepID=UPI00103F37C0|nr:uncharacterized protein LOC114351562 [Ostrinia furnacalis]